MTRSSTLHGTSLRRLRHAAALAALLTALAVLVLGSLGQPSPLGVDGEEEDGLGPAEPDDYFLFQRASGGVLPSAAQYERAVAQAMQVQAATAVADEAEAPRQLRGQWELTGPTNIGGRVVDVALDPRDPSVVYAAAATGGVWKSTDGGATFANAWPDSASQSMGALAMGSDGRLWAGTGETNPGGGSITFGGTGIYMSDDGGATWKKRGLEHSSTTGRIMVHPTNPDIIFVAASGDLFNPGGERGIYRSTTGGTYWELVLAPETPTTGGADLAIDPTNPDRIFAVMWDHRREPDLRTYGGVGSGLFRSEDGGDTWQRLDNVLTLTPGDTTGLSSDPSLGRIGVGLAPTDPNRVYVITIGTFGTNKGFYVSTDGGDTFNTATFPGSQGGFGWWFGRTWVDPADASHLFVAGVNLRESLDGGVTWRNSFGIHVDQHGMVFDTRFPGRVYLGNDGGTYRSDANGAPGTWTKATYEPYTQHYQLDVAELDPGRIASGTQDNGCIRSWQPTVPPSQDTWDGYGCGDGLYTPIDWSDPDIFYGCSQYGSCFRRNEGSSPVTNRTISNGTASQRRNWQTPLVIDPNNPQVLYYAGNQVNVSTDRGDTWTAISPPHPDDLTGTFEPGRQDPAYPNYGTVTTLAVAKTAPQTLYVGTDTGRLWKTDDLGGTWTEFIDVGLPDRWVTAVRIDPRNENVVYVTFSGFRAGEAAAHVFRTVNGGQTWEDVSGNLPNAPVNDVVIDVERQTVYVATDVGVFFLKNGKKNWHAVGHGLPLAPVLDLRLHEPTDTLYVATFGRSTWKVTLN